MHYSAVAALMILTTVLLSACEKSELAALEDKRHAYFGRGAAPAMSATQYPAMGTTQAASVDAISAHDLGPQASMAIAPTTATAAATPAAVPFAYARPSSTGAVARASAPGVPAAATSLAWQWPVQGKVSTPFGKQSEGIANEGVTIAAAEHAPIRATAAGEVAYVGENMRDFGNMVILRHAGGEMSSYAHAERITVAKGMTVKQGDTIGYVGQSGSAKSPQLHFAVRSGDRAIDPLSKLPHALALN